MRRSGISGRRRSPLPPAQATRLDRGKRGGCRIVRGHPPAGFAALATARSESPPPSGTFDLVRWGSKNKIGRVLFPPNPTASPVSEDSGKPISFLLGCRGGGPRHPSLTKGMLLASRSDIHFASHALARGKMMTWRLASGHAISYPSLTNHDLPWLLSDLTKCVPSHGKITTRLRILVGVRG
jgi:hypothetical protein